VLVAWSCVIVQGAARNVIPPISSFDVFICKVVDVGMNEANRAVCRPNLFVPICASNRASQHSVPLRKLDMINLLSYETLYPITLSETFH
jgi:hypothetical protein